MEIKNSTRPSFRAEVTEKMRITKPVTTEPAPVVSSESQEVVTLTPTARSLSIARDTAGTVSFDSARVAQIRAAIAEGNYVVDHEKLAQRMLDFEQLLTRRSSK